MPSWDRPLPTGVGSRWRVGAPRLGQLQGDLLVYRVANAGIGIAKRLKQLFVKRGNPFFLEETVRTLVADPDGEVRHAGTEVRDGRPGQHLRGQRRREAETDHGLDEPPARQPAELDQLDQLAKRMLIH